jgi:hypothetical protein
VTKRLAILTATATTLAALGLGLGIPPATAGPPEQIDHGHILLLHVQTVPGTNPPVPSSVAGCVDLAAGQAVGPAGRDDPRHVDFDGGWFTARTTHVVVPTYPYVDPNGQTVPWQDCDEFLTFVGLD